MQMLHWRLALNNRKLFQFSRWPMLQLQIGDSKVILYVVCIYFTIQIGNDCKLSNQVHFVQLRSSRNACRHTHRPQKIPTSDENPENRVKFSPRSLPLISGMFVKCDDSWPQWVQLLLPDYKMKESNVHRSQRTCRYIALSSLQGQLNITSLATPKAISAHGFLLILQLLSNGWGHSVYKQWAGSLSGDKFFFFHSPFLLPLHLQRKKGLDPTEVWFPWK